MIKHYWNTAIRNISRNKLISLINGAGLSMAIAIFLVLGNYVYDQFQFDKFYPGGNDIYRIDYYEYQEGQAVLESARTHDRTALLVQEYVPQVEAVTRIYNEKAYVFTEDVRIIDQDMLFADSSFFKVFPVKVISGSAETSLIPPKAVMISQSQAKVYFGDKDPMGQILYFNERLPFTITGVFEDIPDNSSIQYDFLLSWSTMPFYGWIPKEGSFNAPWTFTYVRLHPKVKNLEEVNTALTAMANEHITTLSKRGHTARQVLRSYEKIHLLPGLSGEVNPGVNPAILYALLSLAAFILVAAWINYVNLSLAHSLTRANEISVRKIFGASRMAISGQFLIEASLLSLVTFITGYGLFRIISGPLSHLIFDGRSLPSPGVGWLALSFLGFIIITALVALYPAYFISKYRPALILNNRLGTGKSRVALLHQGLLIFQLFLAIAVVSITLIAGRQISFMRSFDAGFNSTQTITLRAPASTNSDSLRYGRYVAFRNEVLQLQAFLAGTSSMNIPGQEIRFHDESVYSVGSKNDKKTSYSFMWIDEGYEETFGMKLLGGRNLNMIERAPVCMINETAARALGFSTPADAVNTKIITQANREMTIVGVWKDYHHESIHKSVIPIIFIHRHPNEYGYYSFLTETNRGSYLKDLETVWNRHYPNDTFVYYFMDQFFAGQYASDQLFEKMLRLFSIISILVSCLGLFGMATLSMVKRLKEIGIRKTLGATVPDILLLISSGYVALIAISCVFAFPVAWYIATHWLDGYAYKINIQWWMLILPGIIVLLTTLITVSIQAVKAALSNPVKVLRDQ